MPDFVRNGLPLRGENAEILLVLTGLILILLIGWLVMSLRLRRLHRQITALTRGVDGRNLEETLAAHLETVAQTARRMDSLEQAVAVLQAQLPTCLRYAHLIRYDAFEDVGGEQSFSLALLDERRNGVVLTSVYSRLDVRVYAKAIRNGQASHTLSEEETRALRECVTV